MSLVDRAALARQMRAFVSQSAELVTLQRAIDLLHPGGPRPNLHELVTGVLYSALRSHEAHTSGVLTRMNDAMGRTLDDLDVLRRGEPIGGRTAGMRAGDLAEVAAAMDELAQLEQRLRFLLDTDPDGTWAQALRAEVEAGMLRPGATAAPLPSTAARGATTGARALPRNVAEGIVALRDAIHAVAPTGTAIWATRELPESIRAAAHNLVLVAGGDIAEAVRRVVRSGGQAADDLVIALLWAERRIEPKPRGLGGADFDMHQRQVTGLDFEWRGELAPGQFGREIGLDGIAGGVVVDAKHLGGTLEESGHVLGGAVPREPRPRWEGGEVQPHDLVDDVAEASRRITPEDRARHEAAVELKQAETLEQMQRQLDWARHHGLDGIQWVCSAAELAEYFRLLADRLPSAYRDMRVEFVVGGMRGARP